MRKQEVEVVNGVVVDCATIFMLVANSLSFGQRLTCVETCGRRPCQRAIHSYECLLEMDDNSTAR